MRCCVGTDGVANQLGVKGAGEAGSVGSPPALINAIIDALSVDGVTHIGMPATPEAVWQALSMAKVARPALNRRWRLAFDD